jgi:L-ascorbate metabolism protein UlaG (beta-lactamase superfamily)
LGKTLPDDTYRGYNGYIIKREGNTILFAGDTAYTHYFQLIENMASLILQ